MSNNLGELLDLAPDKAKEEPWSSLPDGGIVWVARAKEHEIPELYALTQKEVGDGITSLETLQNMQKHNRDAVWGVYRASDNSRADTKLVGYFALIFLNPPGLEALEQDRFDGIEPDMRMVVPSDTRPAAIYLWVVVVRRLSRIAGWLLANALGADRYGGIPIFAKAGTKGGLNALKGRGFSASDSNATVGHLFRLDRPPVPGANAA
ncbi:MAG TPA: hypothetical protein VG867_06585 [Rhizomicrobium sp.]|nr:hypothetical protein [Rhizomicrobium sp.]